MEKSLNEEFFIRNTRIRNRICVPPMVCFNWSDDNGYVTDKNVEHYRAIARGGAGLIIQEATCVTKEGRLHNTQLGIWDDSQVEGLKRITEAVHKEGCPIFVQIHHAGIVGINKDAFCPGYYTFRRGEDEKIGRKMSLEDIKEIQKSFIQAGRRAYEAGYDGVELHGCHSYLISQFFNSRINKRDDVYGRAPERFTLEIMDGMRKLVPESFIIGIRLGAFEPTLEDGLWHAKALEDSGIDFLDISYGFSGEDEPFKPEGFPLKDIIYAAGEFKKQSRVPVFAVNGLRIPEDAIEALRLTDVDMVDIGRSILVDYNWSRKALEGKVTGRCLDCRVCQWRIDPERCAGRLKMRRDNL
jgi:2,4-dienoyl-CoA reductase-like NADH-dependent reductase (Old Yellow Enzyme family)